MSRLKNNQLWALRWHPPGFSRWFSAYIVAEDTQEANYFWSKYRKINEDVAHTWERAFNSCTSTSTFHVASDAEIEDFKKKFPRRRKTGVYMCKEESASCETDHVRD